MLLEALGFLKRNEIDRARSNVLEARRVCDSNGGPTEDQAQLLELLTARLPKSAGRASEPTLNELFPGTVAAPTGQSLVLPGTPSMADLAAKAKEKRAQAAAQAAPGGSSAPAQTAEDAAAANARAQL